MSLEVLTERIKEVRAELRGDFIDVALPEIDLSVASRDQQPATLDEVKMEAPVPFENLANGARHSELAFEVLSSISEYGARGVDTSTVNNSVDVSSEDRDIQILALVADQTRDAFKWATGAMRLHEEDKIGLLSVCLGPTLYRLDRANRTLIALHSSGELSSFGIALHHRLSAFIAGISETLASIKLSPKGEFTSDQNGSGRDLRKDFEAASALISGLIQFSAEAESAQA